MGVRVEIHEEITKKLLGSKDPCSGLLIGISDNSNILVLGLIVTAKTAQYLPVGLEICGYFQTGDELDRVKSKGIYGEHLPTNHVIITTNNKNELDVQVISNGDLIKVDYEVVTHEKVYAQYMFIRCKGSLPIKCEFTLQTIREHFQSLKHQLVSDNDDSKIMFKLQKSQTFLSKKNIMGLQSNSVKVIEVYKDLHSKNDDSNRKKKTRVALKPKVLDFDMLFRLTNDENTKLKKSKHAPVCILSKNAIIAIDTVANIDVLAMISIDKEASDLYTILTHSVVHYLELLQDSLEGLQAKNQPVNFQTFHFLPEDLAHFITLLYQNDQTNETLKPFRQMLHKQLLLDQTVPRFRITNQYLFESEAPSNGPLFNPHEGIKCTDNGGEIALVRGKYQYYHYCQNNMDDNGWGCAYRSLQTLASWFKLQGYVNREVPDFQDIQKCLVDIKDKPANFLGSRQWIGSTEVSFVLSTLLGIDCKILYVSSGEEMGSKGPELVGHFRMHGSPIMIGGGVLAHTILGVDYNQSTGKVKFLILDPHYTGSEDLHTIQSKGWCGWKSLDFWDKTAYYNMCLPQVPRGV